MLLNFKNSIQSRSAFYFPQIFKASQKSKSSLRLSTFQTHQSPYQYKLKPVSRKNHTVSSPFNSRPTRKRIPRLRNILLLFLLTTGAGSFIYTYGDSRSLRVVWAAALIAIDYKLKLRGEFKDLEEYEEMKSKVHESSAKRLLEVFKANGGIYIKLVSIYIHL